MEAFLDARIKNAEIKITEKKTSAIGFVVYWLLAIMGAK
jgi:hypothetical protein